MENMSLDKADLKAVDAYWEYRRFVSVADSALLAPDVASVKLVHL